MPDPLTDAVSIALSNPAFTDLNARFERQRVRTWSTSEERALLFGLASSMPPGATAVELGTYCGGSAIFLAAGLAVNQGTLYCVDPMLGAPPWLNIPANFATRHEFETNIRALNVGQRIRLLMGDSTAVASVWPARPVDLLLIDGDHSYLGTLSDLENWGSKVRQGGLILIDDVDNIEEVRRVFETASRLDSVEVLGVHHGTGVLRVSEPGHEFLTELGEATSREGTVRAWDYTNLHESFASLKPRANGDSSLALIRSIAAGSISNGEIGRTADCPTRLADVIDELAAERGRVVRMLDDIDNRERFYQLIACSTNLVAQLATLVLPGGVLLAGQEEPMTSEETWSLRNNLTAIGFCGVNTPDGEAPIVWGVAGVDDLSPHRIAVSRAKSWLAGSTMHEQQ